MGAQEGDRAAPGLRLGCSVGAGSAAERKSRTAEMFVTRVAGGDREGGIAQHVAGVREMQMFGSVAAAVALEARNDRFAHFRGGPQVVIAAGNQQQWAANIFHWDRGALDCIAIAQSGAKQ